MSIETTVAPMSRIDEILSRESNRITDEIAREDHGIWINGLRREWWPDGVGSVMICDRIPKVAPQLEWKPLLSNVEFVPPPTSFALEFTRVESPEICMNHATNESLEKDLKLAVDALKSNIVHTLRERGRNEYARMCNWIYGSGFNAHSLGQIRDTLERQGMKPPFVLVTDASVTDQFEGFTTIHDEYPIRTGLTNKRILPFRMSDEWLAWSARNPIDPMSPWYSVPPKSDDPQPILEWVPNEAYKTAEFQDSFIFIPEVYTALHAKRIEQPAGDPMKYRGEVRWTSVRDTGVGKFLCHFFAGSKPERTELGYAIRHRRA